MVAKRYAPPTKPEANSCTGLGEYRSEGCIIAHAVSKVLEQTHCRRRCVVNGVLGTDNGFLSFV